MPTIEQGLARPSQLILKLAVSLSRFDTWKAAPARAHSAHTHNGCCQAARPQEEGPHSSVSPLLSALAEPREPSRDATPSAHGHGREGGGLQLPVGTGPT